MVKVNIWESSWMDNLVAKDRCLISITTTTVVAGSKDYTMVEVPSINLMVIFIKEHGKMGPKMEK